MCLHFFLFLFYFIEQKSFYHWFSSSKVCLHVFYTFYLYLYFFYLSKFFILNFNVLVIFLMFGGREIAGNVWRRISESRRQDQ